MKNFISVNDVDNIDKLIADALELKKDPLKYRNLGKDKILGLFFFNPSLRTRISTQKAGQNLGMDVTVLNADKDNWGLEFEEGAIMNGTKVEHIKDAARVLGKYFDILGVRSFPSLTDKVADDNDVVIRQFMKYSEIPMVSLESATRHPLQSLADLVTIHENWDFKRKPKIVLTWAPHVKPIAHSVANSFAEWAGSIDCDFVITHPEGYELNPLYTKNAEITHDQDSALKDADFVYVKNWSSYNDYGKILFDGKGWMIDEKKIGLTNNAGIMHCLPVRRNVELSDYALDSANSLVIKEAENRIYAAQAVLKNILETMNA
jgi:N-succinyl-L-ornithine transcarbamylase